MCGILGYYQRGDSVSVSKDRFGEMLAQLSARGPDESTVYIHDRVGLGHTRLSIIDLSTGGQPLFNETRDVACILNGEIYNFQDLRKDLISRGHVFRSTSDTEVVVHLYEEVGEDVFSRLDGMFAVAIYDQRRGLLLVGRDRIGEKPLYYHDSPHLFVCASEVKALLKLPGISRDLDPDAVAAYLCSLYVPAPLSIFRSIRKLEPGHYLRVDDTRTELKSYWHPRIRIDESLDEAQAIERLRDLLSTSLKRRLVADVPLGIFLSGGIDSSAVVALAAKHANSRLKTYSVGFGADLSELPFARQVADMYGTDHTEIPVTSDLAEELPRVAAYYDEPFADTSSVPTYVLAREARKYVKVALTGDGGDELFAGYERYVGHKYYSSAPGVRGAVRRLDSVASRVFGRTLLNGCGPFQRDGLAYRRWVASRWFFTRSEVCALVNRDLHPEAHFYSDGDRLRISGGDPLSAAFQHDVNFYLPDDLLKKMDMASMAHGLECRAPILDPALVEFALSIPPRLKLHNNVPKYLFRKAMEAELPAELVWRKKQGFGAPVSSWLRNALRSFATEALGERARVHEILDRRAVGRILHKGLDPAGSSDWRAPFQLWIVLMLELWMQNYAP